MDEPLSSYYLSRDAIERDNQEARVRIQILSLLIHVNDKRPILSLWHGARDREIIVSRRGRETGEL